MGRPAGTPEQIQQYVAEGFRFIQGPADLNLIGAGALALLNALGKVGFDPRKQPPY